VRELALVGMHGMVSTVFAAGAVIIGPRLTEAQTEHVILLTYTLVQILAALLIAATARPGWKVPIAVAAAAAAAWGVWCSIVAGMALGGSWL
jgi:hypothetical protein